VRYEFCYDGGGYGKGGTGTLFVDAAEVAEGRATRTVPFRFFAGFDVGADLYTTVCEEIPYGDNVFRGEIDWVRIDLTEGVEIPAEEEVRIALAAQ
jgi:arylsulfatase